MISTAGVLPFDSGYTTNVSTERPSCFTVTHSWWRDDFSSVARAQSCAEANCAAQRISREIRVRRFMAMCLLQRTGRPDKNKRGFVQNEWHCNAARPAPQDSQETHRRETTVPKKLSARTL